MRLTKRKSRGTLRYAAVGLLLMCMVLASCSLNEQTSASLSGALTLAGSTALQPVAPQAARLMGAVGEGERIIAQVRTWLGLNG